MAREDVPAPGDSGLSKGRVFGTSGLSKNYRVSCAPDRTSPYAPPTGRMSSRPGSRPGRQGTATMRNQTHRIIEQQLTVLLRRVGYIHRSTQPGEVALERSAYAIMCHLADEGPHRLGTLATTFGVDASTISR